MDIKLFKEAEKRGHEQVVYFNYPKVGLKAIIGIHNTALGPALGGCRMRLYTDESQALDDVLRLSEGMTYKSALAGLALGGGKACLICDPQMKVGRRELFLQLGQCLNDLGGRYITAEDMGTSVEDVMTMREVTDFAAGFAQSQGGSGDPSPWTARGVFNSMIAGVERAFKTKDLKGKRVALQGVGHVGLFLLKELKDVGAKVTVCDTNKAALEQARNEFGADVVDTDKIYDVDCDVYAPCAIGQTVTPETLARLKCKVICGGANNQLVDSGCYSIIEKKGILYCPDFVINSGGVISVGAERNPGGWNVQWVTEKVKAIYDTIHKVLDEAERRGKFPEVVAVELAKERVNAAAEKRRKA